MTETSSARTIDATEHRSTDLETIREIYADQAEMLDRTNVLNRLITGRYRQRLFGTATGRVLDVACGIGTNVRYLPDTAEYVGIDVSPAMLEKADERIEGVERGEDLLEMDAEDLAFPANSFDTVISSLSTCTFPDPETALQEMERVCRPEGRILLLEHGRSDLGPIAHVQDWRADAHFEKHACRLNQEPVDVVSRAGLSVHAAPSGLGGILTAIDARPD